MSKKLDDGVTVEFALPFIDESCELYQIDIDDIGPLVAEILEQPDRYVGQVLMCVGEVLEFRRVPEIFTKVTGEFLSAKINLLRQRLRKSSSYSVHAQKHSEILNKMYEQFFRQEVNRVPHVGDLGKLL